MARVNKPKPLDAIVLEHDMMLVTPEGKQKPLKAGKDVLINNPRKRGPKSQWFISIEELQDSDYAAIDEDGKWMFDETQAIGV